ncbi:MAG: radical SAM protein [Deltaproteobacteria bacterium]|nr:radical SAM protein [Deltaproteobacteria bacterium]
MSDDITALYRAILAKEKGAIRKNWGGKMPVALAFPNQYRLGMSNLGLQIVYRLLNERTDVVAERFFLPEGREMALYLRGEGPLVSLESQTPLTKFDLAAFSISFENDYPNVLQMLKMGKVPLLSEERGEKDPFVMAGGVASFLNPEPLAPFMDFFLLGEAEQNLHPFVDAFLEFGRNTVKRRDVLLHLARNVAGLYAPSLYDVAYKKNGTLKHFFPSVKDVPEKVKALHAPKGGFTDKGMPLSCITTPDTEFGSKVLVEVSRGCGHACRFCAAGYVYRPPRVYGESNLKEGVNAALKRCPQVGLVSPAVSDVPGIEALMGMIHHDGGRFSVSSLRAENLTRSLLKHLKESGQKTIAIAPEAGSQRLRNIINKHLTEEQILSAARMISGVSNFSIRLYFLMGLPTESSRDVNEITELVKKIKHQMVKESAARGKIGRIKLSVNCFIPKPFTPFQWFPMEEVGSLKKNQQQLKKSLVKSGGIMVNSDVPKWAYIQALLSLGDRRVSTILQSAHKLNGNWKKAMQLSQINPDFFVHRPKNLDELLPWDFIDHGITKKHLETEYHLALEGRLSDICRVGECVRCGVCREKSKSRES